MSRRGALVFLVLSFFLWAISPRVSAQVLRRGNQEPQSLDPHKSVYLFEGTIEHDLYEELVIYAPGGALVGGAAKSLSELSGLRVLQGPFVRSSTNRALADFWRPHIEGSFCITAEWSANWKQPYGASPRQLRTCRRLCSCEILRLQ